MVEHQLLWQLFPLLHLFVVVLLDGQIPKGDPVVVASHSQDAVVRIVELQTGDWFVVVLQLCDGVRLVLLALLDLLQEFDVDRAVVEAERDQTGREPVPTEDVDVDVRLVGLLLAQDGFAGAEVEELEGAVGGAGGEQVGVLGAPVDVLDGRRVHLVGVRHFEAGVVHALQHVQHAVLAPGRERLPVVLVPRQGPRTALAFITISLRFVFVFEEVCLVVFQHCFCISNIVNLRVFIFTIDSHQICLKVVRPAP